MPVRFKSSVKASPLGMHQGEFFFPDHWQWANVNWVVLIWMVLVHAGCLAAPFVFSWSALGVALVLHWITISWGIGLGYHRYLAHRAFKMAAPAEWFIALCGVLTGQGSPLQWAATHRVHHALSDKPGDPHSPRNGAWWSHMFWLLQNQTPQMRRVLYQRFIPDLLKHRVLVFLDRWYGPILFGSAIVFYLIGGLPLLVWGLCVRMTVAYHGTWLVNSATHIFGYRNYQTADDSKNVWWVALLTYGEGWHNNHHAHPGMAKTGHRWWEFDLTYRTIKLFQSLGITRDVNDQLPPPRRALPAAIRSR